MWYGQPSPWRQRNPVPGTGMPPYGQHVPMSMQRPEMRPASALSSNVPLPQGQGGSRVGAAISPAMMGMLANLFSSSQAPTPEQAGAAAASTSTGGMFPPQMFGQQPIESGGLLNQYFPYRRGPW